MNKKHADGLGTQLRRLIELLDGDLEKIYAEDGAGYRPRYTPVMKALADGAPRTIRKIALMSSISHSAASQTVKLMARQGLVRQREGEDARERYIHLTPHGLRLLSLLKLRWRATERAAQALERDVGAPLSAILSKTISALEAKSFRDRIEEAEGLDRA